MAAHSSDDDEEPPAPPPKPHRRRREVTPLAQSPPPRSRKVSNKQAETNKENLEHIKAQLVATQKKLAKEKRRNATPANQGKDANDDDECESEEREEDDRRVTFPSSITAMGTIPLPPQRPPPVLRRSKSAKVHPTTAARAFLQLPEPTAEERALDTQRSLPPSPTGSSGAGIDYCDDGLMPPPPPRSSSPPPLQGSSPSPASSTAHSHAITTAEKRQRPLTPSSVLSSAPPPKRPKPTAQEAKFREGFVVVSGAKPTAGDYASVAKALILRACADYSARILTRDGFPLVGLQTQWAHETFRGACRTAGEHYILSDRIIKIITARGSQIRGKSLDAFRSLFASHFGFQRSATKKIIASNKALSEKLRTKGTFHYKNIDERKGYGENKIISAVRQLTVFHDKTSLGVVFPSYFNPISIPSLALDMTLLEFCANEWSTGSFQTAKFYEKDNVATYRIHLADAEKWNNLDPIVVEKIRRKWYNRASHTLTSAPTLMASNIDQEQEDLMRSELAGRTGDTESESDEAEIMS